MEGQTLSIQAARCKAILFFWMMMKMKKESKTKEKPVFDRDIYYRRPTTSSPSARPTISSTKLSKENPEAFVSMHIAWEEYSETNDPQQIITAFLASLELGIYPPLWVLSELRRLFTERLESHDKMTLEKLFGFTVSGSGKTSPFEKRLVKDRLSPLMETIFTLTLFGYTEYQAAEMVENLLRKTGGVTIGNVKYPGHEKGYMQKIYSCQYSKQYKNSFYETVRIKALQKDPEKYLSQFPSRPKPAKKSKV